MKYLVALFAILALASCGTKTEEKTTTNTGSNGTKTSTSMTNTWLNEEIEMMTGSTMDESKVVKLEAPYENPKAKVDMTIAYELDSEGKVTKMDVSATTFDISAFEEKVEKEAIGKSLEEVSKIFVSGSSLTSEAFQKAIKSKL